MSKSFTASEVRKNGDELFAHNAAITRSMLHAYADRLEGDEMARIQRGVWVLVPREPTEGMLKAAEDAVDAASNCESTTDDLSAIAYKTALAAAPQQAAEPVVWMTPTKNYFGSFEGCTDACNGAPIPLYTHPQPAQDAKDAARMEWYFGPSDKKDWLDTYMRGMREGWSVGQWRAAIDAAMAKESGR